MENGGTPTPWEDLVWGVGGECGSVEGVWRDCDDVKDQGRRCQDVKKVKGMLRQVEGCWVDGSFTWGLTADRNEHASQQEGGGGD